MGRRTMRAAAPVCRRSSRLRRLRRKFGAGSAWSISLQNRVWNYRKNQFSSRDASLRALRRARDGTGRSCNRPPTAGRLLTPSGVVHGWWPAQSGMSTTTLRVRAPRCDGFEILKKQFAPAVIITSLKPDQEHDLTALQPANGPRRAADAPVHDRSQRGITVGPGVPTRDVAPETSRPLRLHLQQV